MFVGKRCKFWQSAVVYDFLSFFGVLSLTREGELPIPDLSNLIRFRDFSEDSHRARGDGDRAGLFSSSFPEIS